MKKITIIGGGLAGLIAAIQLVRSGIPCLVIEKKSYPFHRVCGEYISNESRGFLESIGLFPHHFNPPHIKRFQLSSIHGKSKILPLDLGGFGISRYVYDNFLYEEALKNGVEFLLNTEAENIHFKNDQFTYSIGGQHRQADIIIGAFGKRSKIDLQLHRNFTSKRSPYVGVKYHLRTDHPNDLIALHNFVGGYCGISNVEDGKTNLCYLTHREQLKAFGNIPDMERAVLYKNPLLKEVFTKAEFLYDKPETINEISFETKSPVENHILMIGDAAGMITPLCGNGMAIAIHSAKILSEQVIRYCGEHSFTRLQLEKNYASLWTKTFASRLWRGRHVQNLFGSKWASNVAVNLAIHVKPLANAIIRSTHGNPF